MRCATRRVGGDGDPAVGRFGAMKWSDEAGKRDPDFLFTAVTANRD